MGIPSRIQRRLRGDCVPHIHTAFAFKDGMFTPSQFAGSLIIDRHLEEFTYFEMSVPPSTLNFDVCWEIR